MPDQNVPILIASRSPALAEGLRSFLHGVPVQVAMCHTVDQALALIDRGAPRLLIVDWYLADAEGLELAAELSRRKINVPTVFCLEPGPLRPDREAQALAAGAAGSILLTATREAVVEAISEHLDAGLEPGMARSLTELVDRTGPRRVLLTSQERVVLRLMRQQYTYKEIALQLGVSWHTVRSHAQSVLRKLGIHSRRDLDTWDARLGAQTSDAPTTGVRA